MDIYLAYGQDFIVGPDGDLKAAFGWDEVTQNLTRLIMTNPEYETNNNVYVPPDYLAQPDYGLGMRALLGKLAANNNGTKILTSFATDQIINKALQACATIPAIAQIPVPTAKISNPQLFQYNLLITISLNGYGNGTISIPLTGSGT